MDRITHIITSECEIRVVRLSRDSVRICIEEKDPRTPDPTHFEIEGNPACIAEALATAAAVLINLDQILQEPS
jgi:hypothetical protein